MATNGNEVISICSQFVEEIDFSEISPLKVVGKGTFGVVKKGLWRGINVAIKNIDTEPERRAFTIELRQLSRVCHPNIVKLYGACTKHPNVCLVMEYAEGGSLYNVLHGRNKPKYTLAHAMSWALQCAKGVAYLHAMKPKPLIHRDLKPPNLLLFKEGTVLKICDFGTAADKSTYMTNNKGSAAWMAPEVFEGSSYTEKCDVFSWGIILWEVLSGKKPFEEIGNLSFRILWAVHKGTRPPLLKGILPGINELMERCWDKLPARRPNMEEVVSIMMELSAYYPGGDEPVEYGTKDMCNDDEFDDDDDDDRSYQGSQLDAEMYGPTTNGTNPVSLPQPSSEMMKPLGLQIDPGAWDFESDSSDMEIRTMAGFDKMMPKRNISKRSTDEKDENPSKENDGDLENIYFFLDPQLRPVTPDFSDPQSRQIFEEHKQLAEEYLKVQKDIALLYEDKQNLLESQSEEEKKERQSLQELLSEKESLLKLFESLKTQLQILQASAPPNDWEMIPNQHEEPV